MTPKELGNEPTTPCAYKDFQPHTGIEVSREQYFGLTKREAFAMAAMQGIAGNSHDSTVGADAPTAARWAVEYADYLLAELAKERTP